MLIAMQTLYAGDKDLGFRPHREPIKHPLSLVNDPYPCAGQGLRRFTRGCRANAAGSVIASHHGVPWWLISPIRRPLTGMNARDAVDAPPAQGDEQHLVLRSKFLGQLPP